MRNPKSLFNHLVNYINKKPVGSTFKTSDLRTKVGPYEKLTNFKIRSEAHSYRLHQYKGYLRRIGVLENTKRGEWKVLMHIPEWFDLGHLNILLTYYKWDKEKGNILTYKGLNKETIMKMIYDYNTPVAGSNSTVDYKPSDNSNFSSGIKYAGSTENFITEETLTKVEKIAPEESVFFAAENAKDNEVQLQDNLKMNIGLIRSAMYSMDNTSIIDPLIQGRIVNIFEQLVSLEKTIANRINS